jgi:hypothetical protein
MSRLEDLDMVVIYGAFIYDTKTEITGIRNPLHLQLNRMQVYTKAHRGLSPSQTGRAKPLKITVLRISKGLVSPASLMS